MPLARSTLAPDVQSASLPIADASGSLRGSPRSSLRIGLPYWMNPKSWHGRLFWLIVLIGPIWLLDKPLYDMHASDRNIFLLGDIRDVTRQFGEPLGIAWIAMVMWFLDKSRRRPLVIALIATSIASGLSSGTKLLIGRERPRVSQGYTVIRGAHWPGTMDPDPSLPSGHTTVACAFAFCLSQLYPKHRAVWLFLAIGCGVSRALGEAHFLTDVVVGGWMGWEIARIVWCSLLGPRLMRRMDRRIPAHEWFPRWDWSSQPQAA
jgi:membrane-associated phospholipid phosphatase